MSLDATQRGAKHLCPRCQTRFYDLLRPQVLCPKCGADPVAEAALAKAQRAARKRAPSKAPKPKPTPVVDAEDDDPLDAVDDDDDDDEDDDAV